MSSKNLLDVTMGNPQERSRAWLGGIVDGEGSVTFQAYMMKNGNLRVTPFICINNNDDGIIQECKRILDEFNIKHHWHDRGDKVWIGRIDGEPAVLALIDVIEPYLYSKKKDYCRVVREYIKDRSENRTKQDNLGHITRLGYTKHQIDLICSVRTSPRAKSSETLRQAANYIG